MGRSSIGHPSHLWGTCARTPTTKSPIQYIDTSLISVLSSDHDESACESLRKRSGDI